MYSMLLFMNTIIIYTHLVSIFTSMADSIEVQTLFECRPKLLSSIGNNLDDISTFLRKEGVIDKKTFDEVTKNKSGDGPKSLYEALENKIEEDDSMFKRFMEYLSTKRQYFKLKDTVAAEYAKRGIVYNVCQTIKQSS